MTPLDIILINTLGLEEVAERYPEGEFKDALVQRAKDSHAAYEAVRELVQVARLILEEHGGTDGAEALKRALAPFEQNEFKPIEEYKQ